MGAGHVIGELLGELDDAEVEHLGDAIRPQHHVLGFDVSMNDAGAMRGGQRARDLNGNINGLSQAEPGVLQPLTHRLAFDELRRDEASAFLRAYFVDGDDVRMIES